MRRRKEPFKNALCQRVIPEGELSEGWLGLDLRRRRCQRRSGHPGQHRSWAREWNEGDKESRMRR